MIREGQRFTFFAADGTRRDDYVVQALMRADNRDEDHPSALVTLRNERTGRNAAVTRFWLTQGRLPGRMHWLPTERTAA